MSMTVAKRHLVTGNAIEPPFPDGTETAIFCLGCFWGAELTFWTIGGVWTTAVGYTGGYIQNPSYDEVCSGRTGHAEAVLVVFEPITVSYDHLLQAFWEAHDPTQGMRQGADVGTQYRSAIYTTTEDQQHRAVLSLNNYQKALRDAGLGKITTTIAKQEFFYYAEQYHQQYLAKNPGGYCGAHGTGIKYSSSK